jgi:putative phosphoribosyl transferase
MSPSIRQEISYCKGLAGVLTLPSGAHGLIAFAHGSGSNRMSPRNTFVADELQDRGFGTLLFDLMSPDEAADRRNVFDVPLLAGRVGAAIEWIFAQRSLAHFKLGLFGASTGAAAALVAAADRPDDVAAVVSRGGRPDLAGDALPRVRAPTLLIVGGQDQEVLALNRGARAQMICETELIIVPRATHLFEEAGTLEDVSRATSAWFENYLR